MFKRTLIALGLALFPLSSKSQTVDIDFVAAAEPEYLKDWDETTFEEYVKDPKPMGAGFNLGLNLDENHFSFTYFNTSIAKKLVPPLKIDGERFHESFSQNTNITQDIDLEGKIDVIGNWNISGSGFRVRLARDLLTEKSVNSTFRLFGFTDYFGLDAKASASGNIFGRGTINFGSISESVNGKKPFDLYTDITSRGFSIGLRPEINLEITESISLDIGWGLEFKSYHTTYEMYSDGERLELPNGLKLSDGYEKIKPNYVIGLNIENFNVQFENNSIVSGLLSFGFNKKL